MASEAGPAERCDSVSLCPLGERGCRLYHHGRRANRFERLTSDEEREKFIEQFWERRDPKSKEEHYRRIANANARFGKSGKSGWQTDRGRMYIVYGPPDEIESHPNGGVQTVYPFEAWKYRYLEGIGNNLFFTFIDRTRTGDYRPAPGNGNAR